MRTLLPVLLLLALAGPAAAHRLNVEARVEGGVVLVDVYFSDGVVPEGALVVVTRDGQEVARGAVDAAGRFAFTPPAPGRYLVAVTEPGLHRGDVEVVVGPEDPGAAPVASAASVSSAGPPAAEAPRGSGGGWLPTLAGVVIVLSLAGVLALWQRRRGAP